MDTRLERDNLGERQLPEGVLYAIHGLRARENFLIAGHNVHPALLAAFGQVKQACLRVNHRLLPWPKERFTAMEQACVELAGGGLREALVLDALQGGAGTSTNLGVCEVLANRALEVLGEAPGTYTVIHPGGDLNRHQSTNDTFPTALRIAALEGLRCLETALGALCDTIMARERDFAGIVRVGRTQFEDAVPTTLGRLVGAWGEALGRDRWRLHNAAERLRVVNLGGTAIGTGLGAPREYIFAVVPELNRLTGLGLCRAENLVEATQNTDTFVEVSGLLTACAVTLQKISGDLRLLGARREAGQAELLLPALQEGSSIMPGKINPVIPEAVIQATLTVQANHQRLSAAAALGSLELNAFLPLIAEALLESLDLLARSVTALDTNVMAGLRADEETCRRGVHGSAATLTALIPLLGHTGADELGRRWRSQGGSLRDTFLQLPGVTAEDWDRLLGAEAVNRLGWDLPPQPREET